MLYHWQGLNSRTTGRCWGSNKTMIYHWQDLNSRTTVCCWGATEQYNKIIKPWYVPVTSSELQDHWTLLRIQSPMSMLSKSSTSPTPPPPPSSDTTVPMLSLLWLLLLLLSLLWLLLLLLACTNRWLLYNVYISNVMIFMHTKLNVLSKTSIF